ncbi:TPA: hypothetical protein ACU967_002275 [Burkholderia contaminans]|uniref:hypothetical protein n=1 Tax=Burkholderia contaminans TaxID=488447 RepID=UPI000CFED99C|nr:hypothetical protein [Burkholderia contaminans]HDR9065517.1 hypothetical protein [Burkholderia vietnamiensis]MBM6427956.1 hypothetical protein [Burkholderia contaminans]MCA7876787.1 hypothetical protein [Burkholderia contaminans]MDN8024190.1 hypothetical protein [Burkholderia contaminans]PRG12191.1 hypothetical protein C6Q17_14125 [Burkholderia contaminans]
MQSKPLKQFTLFKTVDQALTKVYEVRATSGVKTASYGIQTAASSSTDRLSPTDRLTEATWVIQVVDAALNEAQRAYVTGTYDGLGTEREEALDCLTRTFPEVARRAPLVREIFIREFDFGETYSKPLPQIALECDVSLSTVEKSARKARDIVKTLRGEVETALRAAFEPRGWLRARSASAT